MVLLYYSAKVNFKKYRVQSDSGTVQPPIPWVPGPLFLEGKAAGAWSWPLTSIWCRDQECVELYFNYPNTPSRRGFQL